MEPEIAKSHSQVQNLQAVEPLHYYLDTVRIDIVHAGIVLSVLKTEREGKERRRPNKKFKMRKSFSHTLGYLLFRLCTKTAGTGSSTPPTHPPK